MKLDFKQVGIGVGIATAVGLAGYSMNAFWRNTPKVASPAPISPVAGKAAVPFNHPHIAPASRPQPVEREGKVEVDRLAKFVHFPNRQPKRQGSFYRRQGVVGRDLRRPDPLRHSHRAVPAVMTIKVVCCPTESST